MNNRLLISIGVIALLAGCKGENAKVDLGYAYYPAEVGAWISYDVDSIRHFPDESVDTVRYQIRELVESAFTDEAGRPARRIERYYRDSSDEDWGIKDIWMVAITNRKVEKVEENIRYVRLTFPVRNDQLWDGNALNDFEPWNYSYAEVDQAYSVEGNVFDTTATVNQEGAVNLIEQRRGQEVYAKNLGLVYKELVDIETDVNYSSNPVPENIQSGYELYYKYLDHGQN